MTRVATVLALLAALHAPSAWAQAAADLPEEILQLAQARLQREKDYRPVDNSSAYIRDYLADFFRGFAHHDRAPPDQELARFRADAAGGLFWHSFPEKREDVFAAFGYRKVTLKGIYTRGVHTDEFRAATAPTLGVLEMFPVATCNCSIPGVSRRDRTAGSTPLAVQATGFVGPTGRFGHMGSVARMFYAIEMHPADG